MGKMKSTMPDYPTVEYEFIPEPMFSEDIRWALSTSVMMTSDVDEIEDIAKRMLGILNKMRNDIR